MTVEVIRLTPTMASRKNQVLSFICSYHAAHGEGPSISEIAEAVNCARSRAQEAIRKLEAAGYIVNPGRLELITPPPQLIDLDEQGRLKVG